MTGLEISLGAVGQDASRLRTHAEEHNSALNPLVQRGDGVSSWGDDGMFGMFAGIYADARETSMAALTALSTALGETGDGLHRVVRNNSEAEAANARNAGDIWR
ncbi:MULTISPECIES: hypothetical protein [unclassified Nonomuraea]|uniref:hypothetical protein n=1 Tax=unclassified Nonomuraea TaxID=2593643 RepID=UPI0033CAB4BC